jgi:hypothetical protein
VVGNAGDAAASGSITVTLSDGAVTSNGGIVPPIILNPAGTLHGTLAYRITKENSVTGTMILWDINGTSKVSEFGASGDVAINAGGTEESGTYFLTMGRYIAEIRLVNESGNIALLREVVEVWASTTTTFDFAPTVYVDPSAVLAYSGATLAATSAIGGVSIGTGTGNGEDEANAISHALG